MYAFDQIADGLKKSRIYWTYGPPPKGAPRSDVDDPPTSGWSVVLVLDDPDPKSYLLFCPYSFRSYRVTRHGYEATSMQGAGGRMDGPSASADFKDDGQAYFKDMLITRWISHSRMASPKADWAIAARVFDMLGLKQPSEAEIASAIERTQAYAPPASQSRADKPAGKPAQDKSAFKVVKREGRKGEVLKAILDGQGSADALTSKFGISRSNLLSQLFLLRKNHGIGYTVSGDAIALEMPEGVTDPFAS